MDARERRLAENEVLFREINDRIKTAADAHGSDSHVYEFFCECSNRDCTLLIPMSIDEYQGLRAEPTHFATAPGHHLPEIEVVVERNDAYWVVEKRGEAGALAEEQDPDRS
jgi:hypothetical protein